MDKLFDSLASQIKMVEELRKSSAEHIRTNKTRLNGAELIIPVEKGAFNGNIAAVDGGLLAKELHGCDLVLTRAVAAIFEYENNILKKHYYHPEPSPIPKLDGLANGLDIMDFNWYQSIARLKSEIGTAIETVEKFELDMLLLDGSILPQTQDRPAESSEIRREYLELLELYKKLYKKSTDKGCKLLSVIKDCRAKRIVEMLKAADLKVEEKKVLEMSNDTLFLQFLLKKGERTCVVPYSNNWIENSILKELAPWGQQINVFYMQCAEMDRPMRIEMIGSDTEEVASKLYSLSAINEKYAYPAVLIEADLRAALLPEEMGRAYRSLFGRLGNVPSLMNLKRNSRPFR